jgi:SPP1 gp7 family putative phage head morphogenesis protein
MIIAKNMVGPDSPLQKIGINRARMIARTEIIRAHAEGQLDALEKLGVDKVGVMVEWSTAGDDRVCSLCMSLEGVVLKIKEARGLIPRHISCRCAFSPANVGEGPDATRRVNYGEGVIDVGQVRGKKAIQASIRRSVSAERVKGSFASKLKKSRWAGADKVSRK